MVLAKREVSGSLDEDLVAQLERERQGLSVQVNAAVRADLESHRRHKLLEEYLDRLDGEHGPVNEALVEKYVGLLALLNQIATGLHEAPALSDEAVSRAGIYADHP